MFLTALGLTLISSSRRALLLKQNKIKSQIQLETSKFYDQHFYLLTHVNHTMESSNKFAEFLLHKVFKTPQNNPLR